MSINLEESHKGKFLYISMYPHMNNETEEDSKFQDKNTTVVVPYTKFQGNIELLHLELREIIKGLLLRNGNICSELIKDYLTRRQKRCLLRSLIQSIMYLKKKIINKLTVFSLGSIQSSVI